jgi:hypothetical protein
MYLCSYVVKGLTRTLPINPYPASFLFCQYISYGMNLGNTDFTGYIYLIRINK